MKHSIAALFGLLCLLIIAPASAETRALDSDWHFTDGQPAYQLHWPLEQAESGWRVVIDMPDGSRYFEGRIADPEADPLLDDSNRRGAFVFYRDNGEIELEGRYADNGLITGRAVSYRKDGSRAEIRRSEPDGYYVIKSFHPDGSLAMERLPDKGERTDRQAYYHENGTLRTRQHTEPDDQGRPMAVVLDYDEHGKPIKRHAIREDVQIDDTLDNGQVVERLTTDRAGAWSLRERFDANGRLIHRDRRLLPEYEEDGEQISTTDDGVRRVSHYRNGQQDGPFHSQRGDRWLSAGAYKDGQPVGHWFEVDKDSGAVTVTDYDDAGQYLSTYRIDADLLTHDAHGKPTLPKALQEVQRTLPPPGSTWTYQFNDAAPISLTLKNVQDGVARYSIGDDDATRNERLNDYQSPDVEHGPALKFPLHPGDTWQYDTEQTVHVPVADGTHWQYRYRTHVTSHVAAIEKIHVGAGSFTALRISREIAWRKDRPQGEGSRLDAIESSDDGAVEGFTRDLLWYAPKAGRVVLKAHMESGYANLLDRDAADLLDNAATWFTELVAFTGPGETAHPGQAQYARAPRAGWIGFAMHRNNTWEYLMQNHTANE